MHSQARRLGEELERLRRVVTADTMLSGTQHWKGELMPDWLWPLLCYQGEAAPRRKLAGWGPPPRQSDGVEEARSRIRVLLRKHEVLFNGAIL